MGGGGASWDSLYVQPVNQRVQGCRVVAVACRDVFVLLVLRFADIYRNFIGD